MHYIDSNLARLGLTLPVPPKPAGRYKAVLNAAGLLFLSGQFPFADGKLAFCGSIDHELTFADGQQAARLSALNVLAHLREHTAHWEGFGGLVRLDGYVSSAPGFFDQPKVLDAASNLFAEVLGEKSEHARTAFAVPQLPLNAAIELVVIAKLSTAG